MINLFVSMMAVLALVSGCGRPQESSERQAPKAPADTPGNRPQPPEKQAAAATPPAAAPNTQPNAVTDPSFELRAQTVGNYTEEQLGRFSVTLVPRGEYYINQKFPTSVNVTAPENVKLPKARLVKKDAAEFTEQKVRFDVPFTPSSSGDHQIESRVAYAVCTKKVCIPYNKTLKLDVTVKPAAE